MTSTTGGRYKPRVPSGQEPPEAPDPAPAPSPPGDVTPSAHEPLPAANPPEPSSLEGARRTRLPVPVGAAGLGRALPTVAPDPETGSRGPYGPAHAASSGERPPPRPPAAPAAGERPRRARVPAALVAAGGALLVAATVSVLFGGLGGTEPRPVFCPGDRCASTARKASPPPGLRYRTVERDVGYFEGTVTIVNRGTRPVRAWTLSFTYPGADVHNAWEVVLRQKGQNVVIVNAPTAEPIPPGDSFEVRFGGAGRPSTPTGCRLNGAPCTFIR